MELNLRPTLIQAAPQITPPIVDQGETVGTHLRWKRWVKFVLFFCALLVVVDIVGAILLQREHVRRRLDARLEAAFGRPVEVENYSFGLWGGPTLQADGVTVGEDPRFGHEYFLRADSLSVRLRWLSLVRGRFELESLSLAGPTVNVVNNASGDWNLAEWLGHAPTPAVNSIGPVRVPFVPRFRAIQIDEGRINFKRGDEKLPFAFVNVSGNVSADAAGKWTLDLDATPWRAAELLQEAGTIHLQGSVGGTSSALRPANLEVNWGDASLSDFLRLVRGDDSGVRGTLQMAFNAQTVANGWTIEGQAQLAQLHRWDLTLRPDTPSLRITTKMSLNLAASAVELSDVSLDAPRSNLRATGNISWGAVSASAKAPSNPVTLNINSAAIDLADALSWVRAFRGNVPDSVNVSGFARATGVISGWPLRLVAATADTPGGLLSVSGESAHLGTVRVQYDGGALQIAPAMVTIADANGPAGLFRVEMAAAAKKTARQAVNTGLHIEGNATDAGGVLALADSFGWDLARGWQIAGPLRCDLRWPQMEWPWRVRPTGTMSIGTPDEAASLRAPFLNLPVSGLQLRVDWKPGTRHVALASAAAFGAHWIGTLDRADSAAQWQFVLASDRLTSADLDRWLNPRWRESFIDRVLPFLSSGSPATAVPDDLRGSGHLSIGQFSAAPFLLENLAGDLTISGRNLVFDNARAAFADGTVDGTLKAELQGIPAFDVAANFSGVDLGAISSAQATSAALFGGIASGDVRFQTQGATRADLASSLECKGSLKVRDASWSGVALIDSIEAAKLVPGDDSFGDASVAFACANGLITLKDIVLANTRTEMDGSGTADFARNLDLLIRATSASGTADSLQSASASPVHVTGTLAAPNFSRAAPVRRSR